LAIKRQGSPVEKGLDRSTFEITDDVVDWAARIVGSAKATTQIFDLNISENLVPPGFVMRRYVVPHMTIHLT
jgi:hypothetical protein